jgi:hypothetical protein
MVCRVALVRTEVSEELGASIIKGTRMGELVFDFFMFIVYIEYFLSQILSGHIFVPY